MQWNVGLQGLGILLLMSLAFGAFAQLVFWHRAGWWVGVVGAAAAFVGGILISEVWFGWATEKELQPNIDGLSFDETLIGFLVGGLIVLALRYLARGRLRGSAAH